MGTPGATKRQNLPSKPSPAESLPTQQATKPMSQERATSGRTPANTPPHLTTKRSSAIHRARGVPIGASSCFAQRRMDGLGFPQQRNTLLLLFLYCAGSSAKRDSRSTTGIACATVLKFVSLLCFLLPPRLQCCRARLVF